MQFLTSGTSRHALAAGVLAALAACGGGGGGGGDGTLPPVTVQPTVDITQQNMNTVAVEALDAGGAGVASALSTITGAQLQAAPVAAPAPLPAIGRLLRAAVGSRRANLIVGAVYAPPPFPCTGGGTVALTLTYRSEQAMSPGDTFRLVATNCVEAEGTINGTLVLVVVDGTADASYIVSDATATALSVASGGLREQIDGTMRLSLDDRAPAQSLIDVTTARLDARQYRNGTLMATRSLLDYDYALAIDNATQDSRENFGYRVTGSFPTLGSVSWAARTTTTIYTPGNALNPTAGLALVNGLNGTTLKISVISSNGGGVRLDLDRGGEGVVDVTRDLTWAELDALRNPV